MVGAGPPSTPFPGFNIARRGYRAMTTWETSPLSKGRPSLPAACCNVAARVASASWWAQAHHPRLSLASTPPGGDAGPEPVPGLVPGARHDLMAATVPPARYVRNLAKIT